MRKGRFRALFVLGPLLTASVVPSLLFGLLIGEWGSNIIWGSYFGLGWCLWGFASANSFQASTVGLIWGWLALVPLYVGSGWLWERLNEKSRHTTAILLVATFAIIVPAHTIMGWAVAGFHLPDYSLHAATAY